MSTYFRVNFSEFNQHGLTQSLGLCPLNMKVLIVGMHNAPYRLMYWNTRYPAGGAVLGTVDTSGTWDSASKHRGIYVFKN